MHLATWRGVVEVVNVKQFSSSAANGQFTWWWKNNNDVKCPKSLRRNILGKNTVKQARQTFLLLSPFHHKTAPSSRNFSHFSSSLWKYTNNLWIQGSTFPCLTWTFSHGQHKFSWKVKLEREIYFCWHFNEVLPLLSFYYISVLYLSYISLIFLLYIGYLSVIFQFCFSKSGQWGIGLYYISVMFLYYFCYISIILLLVWAI